MTVMVHGGGEALAPDDRTTIKTIVLRVATMSPTAPIDLDFAARTVRPEPALFMAGDPLGSRRNGTTKQVKMHRSLPGSSLRFPEQRAL